MAIKIESVKEKQDEKKIYILNLKKANDKKERFEVKFEYNENEEEWSLYPRDGNDFSVAELEAILKVIKELNQNKN